MILKESQFYKIFYFFVFIFCFKEIFWAYNNIGPASFYEPNGILSLFSLSYSEFNRFTAVIRWMALLNSLVLLFADPHSKAGFWLHCLLAFFIMIGTAFRFSFSHYPQLEMLPVLIMLGFIFEDTLTNKIEVSIKSASLVYFFSGLAKLKYSQWSWLDGEVVQQVFLYSSRMRSTLISTENILSIPVGFWTLLGVLTLCFELLFPFMIYFRKADNIFFIFITIFHVAIALSIGIYSTALLLVLLLFFVRAYVVFQEPTKD